MKYLVILFLISSLVSCRDYGTEGGNPQTSNDSGELSTPASFLSYEVCQKRDICLGSKDNSCFLKANESPHFTLELAINPPYENMSQLYADEKLGKIETDFAAFDDCAQSIRGIACDNALALDAFKIADYENLHLVFRSSSSCSKIFRVR